MHFVAYFVRPSTRWLLCASRLLLCGSGVFWIAAFDLTAPGCGAIAQSAPPSSAHLTAPSTVRDLIGEALANAAQVADPGAKVEVLCAIGTTQALAGNAADAQKTFQMARQIVGSWANPERAGGLRTLALALAQAKETLAAKENFDACVQCCLQIADLPGRVDALAVTAGMQSKAGLMKEASQTFALAAQITKQISDPVPHAFALCSIAYWQVRSPGMMPSAKATAREAVTVSEAITDHYWHGRVCGMSLVGVLASTGDLPGAKTMFEGIADEYMKSRGGWGLSSAQASAHDYEAAGQTLQSMKDAYIRSTAIASVVSTQVEAGDLVGASRWVPQITDGFRKEEALKYIAVAQAKRGNLEAARVTAAQLTDTGLKQESASALAEAQARSGDVAGAHRAALQINDANWKATTLGLLADAVLHSAKQQPTPER